jgi:hypothetical protein
VQCLVSCCLIEIHRGVLCKCLSAWRLHLKPETILGMLFGDLT